MPAGARAAAKGDAVVEENELARPALEFPDPICVTAALCVPAALPVALVVGLGVALGVVLLVVLPVALDVGLDV